MGTIERISVNFDSQVTYTAETKTINGTEYLLVPVVMMVEGVHHGSAGAIYHSADELGKNVEMWEGMPVTISHPEINGQYVSAQNEIVQANWAVGYVTEPKMVNNKLTAKVCLSVQRLVALSPETLEAVKSGQIMEVSVGIFSDDEEVEGDWNGEHYTKIARNHRPDHLALLPGETGACSCDDGCGLRTNKKGGKNVIVFNKQTVKDLVDLGFTPLPMVNATGMSELLGKLQGTLNTKDNENEYYYLEEAFDEYFIYVKSSQSGRDLYKQEYQLNEDGTVNLVGGPIRVTRKIEYVTVQRVRTNKKNNMCEKCEEKAQALINHASTNFDENDLVWLKELTEEKLDKMIPKVVQVNKAPTVEEAWEIIKVNVTDVTAYIDKLPENVKQEVNLGLQTFKNSKTILVNSILEATSDTWTKEELELMSYDVLQKLEKSVKHVTTDYSVNNAGGGTVTKSKVTPLTPVNVK